MYRLLNLLKTKTKPVGGIKLETTVKIEVQHLRRFPVHGA